MAWDTVTPVTNWPFAQFTGESLPTLAGIAAAAIVAVKVLDVAKSAIKHRFDMQYNKLTVKAEAKRQFDTLNGCLVVAGAALSLALIWAVFVQAVIPMTAAALAMVGVWGSIGAATSLNYLTRPVGLNDLT